MIQPKKLKEGDKIALIATSGYVTQTRVKEAVDVMLNMGFLVEVGESCYSKYGYFAGCDEIRAKDINMMFKRKDIDGIFVIRGGYGVHRLINLIDYNIIKSNPKFFAGYSDVTGLHLVFNQKCGFVTYHTPMPGTEIYKGLDKYTLDYITAVFSNDNLGKVKNPIGVKMETLVAGQCEGIITGGNLTLVTRTLGTHYEIDTKDKILLLEEVDEQPYKVDGMINQLKNSKKLDECCGIILGSFTNCKPLKDDMSLTLKQIFNDLVVPVGKPAIANVAIGHCLPTMSIPLGVNVKMDSVKCEIIF